MDNILDIYLENIENFWIIIYIFLIVAFFVAFFIGMEDFKKQKKKNFKKNIRFLKNKEYKKVNRNKPALILFFLIILTSALILYPIFWNGTFSLVVSIILFLIISTLIYFLKHKAEKIIYVKDTNDNWITLEKKD